MKLRFANAFASLLGGVLFLSGCAQNDDQVIKIGEFASLTGKEATFGTSSHEGTLLAIEEINAEGGVLGKTIKLITEDNRSREGDSATVMNKLISRDGVVAVLGEVATSRSLEAAPIAQNAGVPMISPASTNPIVTEVGDYVFRVCFTDKFQGASLGNFALNSLNAKKVAMLTDVKSDYSKGLAKYFKDHFLKAGGELTSELDYNGGDKDFKSQLTAVRGSGAQALFVPGYYTEVSLIALQAKELGLTIPLFGGDGWESPDLLKVGGEALNGNYFSTHSSPDSGSPKMNAFVENYKKRFNGKTPDAMAALGYDSAYVLADAIKRAGSLDKKAIRDALAQTKDFDGVTGTFSLNENRDAEKAATILKIEDGQFKYHDSIAP